jgi:hypothetical protein
VARHSICNPCPVPFRLWLEWDNKVYFDYYDCELLTYQSRRSSSNSSCQAQTAGTHKHDPESGMSGGLAVLSYVIGLLDNGLGWLLASIPLYACSGLGDFGDLLVPARIEREYTQMNTEIIRCMAHLMTNQ